MSKVTFVAGSDKRIPNVQAFSDGPFERILRLAFHVQDEPALIPTVVARDKGAAEEPTRVPRQAFLVAPVFNIFQACLSPRKRHTTPLLLRRSSSDGGSDGGGGSHDGVVSVVPPPPPHIDAAGVSLTGYAPGYKDANQDAALLLDTFLSNRQQLVAVMDGHGPEGHHVSAFVRRNLPYTLLGQLVDEGEALSGGSSRGNRGVHGAAASGGAAASPSSSAADGDGGGGGPVQRALWRAVTLLDEQLAGSGIDVVNSGTTAALCHVHGRRLTAAWVGDSRMVLGLPARAPAAQSQGQAAASGGGGDGGGSWRVAWSSTDHKPDLPAEARRIEAAGGRVARSVGPQGPVGPFRVWFKDEPYPGLAMSRALGDLPGRRIGVTCSPSCASLRLPDSGPAVLVVASDGVWDLLGNQQVLEMAAGAGSAAEAASRVAQQSRRAWVREYGGSYVDDITALVVRFDMPQRRS